MNMKMYGGKRSMKRSMKRSRGRAGRMRMGGSSMSANRGMMGGKKSNGHKSTCSSPICKNMKKSRGTRRRRR